MEKTQMGRLMGATGSGVPVQSWLFRGLEAGLRLPALAFAGGTSLQDTMPILRRRGMFLLICAKRTVDKWVAAAIVRHQRQVSGGGAEPLQNGLRRWQQLNDVIR